MVKNLPAMQETLVQSLGRRPPEEGHANLLQCSCLENPVDRGACGYSLWGHKESDTTEVTSMHANVLYL